MIKEEMCRVENQDGRKMAARRWKSLRIKPKAQQKWKSQLCFQGEHTRFPDVDINELNTIACSACLLQVDLEITQRLC